MRAIERPHVDRKRSRHVFRQPEVLGFVRLARNAPKEGIDFYCPAITALAGALDIGARDKRYRPIQAARPARSHARALR